MSKQITLGKESRDKMLVGVNKIADAVKVTLGSKGRNVIIENMYGSPQITKDGVTVAKTISLEDPIENMGAQLIKEVASRTVDTAGDGTTTATVLAQAIIQNALKAIDGGSSPIDVKNGIERAVVNVVAYIKEQSKQVECVEELRYIATISANGDTAIGNLVADTFHKIGKDGDVTVEMSKGSTETTVTIMDGMGIPNGFSSPYFVTNPQKMTCELNDVYILAYEGKISSKEQVVPALSIAVKAQKPLVIIADEIEGEALSILVMNKVQSGMAVSAIKYSSLGVGNKESMEDLCVLLGARYVSEVKGDRIEEVTAKMLGTASKVVSSEYKSLFAGGGGGAESVAKRCEELQALIESTKFESDKISLKKRLANLKSGVAVISVGGFTDTEISEKKDRLDDAVCATRSAIEEGYVAGGGSTFMQYKYLRDGIIEDDKMESILYDSIQAPFMQVMDNAGISSNDASKELTGHGYGVGIDANTGMAVDFFKKGIIDPAKVLRCALENAASVASVFITTECAITETRELKK